MITMLVGFDKRITDFATQMTDVKWRIKGRLTAQGRVIASPGAGHLHHQGHSHLLRRRRGKFEGVGCPPGRRVWRPPTSALAAPEPPRRLGQKGGGGSVFQPSAPRDHSNPRVPPQIPRCSVAEAPRGLWLRAPKKKEYKGAPTVPLPTRPDVPMTAPAGRESDVGPIVA